MPVALGPLNVLAHQVGDGANVGAGYAQRLEIGHAPAAAGFARKLAGESARQVEPRRTPLTAATARKAISDAHLEVTGEVLSDAAADILTAQWAHETGNGASMYNFNFGGIKGTGPSGLTVTQKTREGYGASERQITDSFRAYPNVEEGARDYVQLLVSRYSSAVQSARQGDASGFVRGLKQKGYFTGDPVAYERSIASIANRISGLAGELRTPAGVAINSQPNAMARGVSDRGSLSRSLPEWQAPLAPTALLDLSRSEAHAAPGIDSFSQLSAVRALEMQDEITRAALRIAIDKNDVGGSDDSG